MNIKAKFSIGMHFGTFMLAEEPVDEPVVKLQEAKQKYNIKDQDVLIIYLIIKFIVLNHGGTNLI